MNKSNVVVAGLVCHSYCAACCGVTPSGKPVQFGDQSNIVVWNPQTKTEHFVRNAYFNASSPDFGFIAPTPSKPTLSTADEEAYDFLNDLRPRTKGGTRAAGGPPAGAAETGGPRILQHVTVGKYEATTLQSTNAKSIESYLKKNGYATSRDFQEWAAMYAKKGWMLTAFKVRKVRGEASMDTGIIRMSFKTDKPFNPYYVPKNNSGGTPSLRIFFVSDGVYSASVGGTKPWGNQRWSSAVPAYTSKLVAEKLKLKVQDMPSNPTVTYFEKWSWLDGAKDDLYFKKN